MRCYLDPGHGDSGRSRFSHVTVGRASLHQVPGVGHVHAPARSKHKVLSQGIHQHDDHPFKKGLRESSGVGSTACDINTCSLKKIALYGSSGAGGQESAGDGKAVRRAQLTCQRLRREIRQLAFG